MPHNSPVADQAPEPVLTPITLRRIKTDPIVTFPGVLKELCSKLVPFPALPYLCWSRLEKAAKTGIMGEPSLAWREGTALAAEAGRI